MQGLHDMITNCYVSQDLQDAVQQLGLLSAGVKWDTHGKSGTHIIIRQKNKILYFAC